MFSGKSCCHRRGGQYFLSESLEKTWHGDPKMTQPKRRPPLDTKNFISNPTNEGLFPI